MICRPRYLWFCFAAVLCLTAGRPAHAVINPSLQPWHLAQRYLNIMTCRVTAIDRANLSATLKVEGLCKGTFAAGRVTLTAGDRNQAEAILTLQPGQSLVAYVGKDRRRHENDILYYIGRGVWYLATLDGAPDKWKILANADQGKDPSSSQVMFGTFNGETESLWEMMQDTARGRAYFPAVPQTRMTAVQIARLGGPVRGVGLYDVNGDGRLDVLACSPAGTRLFCQDQAGRFIDRTAAVGLDKTSAASCSIADVDGDGDADLLLDGRLYRQADGRFSADPALSVGPPLLSAAFLEYDGDGYPDVLVSRPDRGLALYRNPGPDGGPFQDKTESSGLAELTGQDSGGGYFEVCDWDLDGRTDLLYLAGPGWLLWQNASGRFEASELGAAESDFTGGTAAFGMIVRPDRPSAYLVCPTTKALFCEDGSGNLIDVIQAGNEIQDPAPGLLMALAEDLNADGTVDLYAACRRKGTSAFFVANRGYGSFLQPEKYRTGKVIDPQVYNQPAWGLAAGDVNDDGAVDLLAGMTDGRLILLVNQTLADRPTHADPATINDLRKQIHTRLLTVCPAAGKGLTGARLSLLDADGRLVTCRWLGTNVGVGCSGPARFFLAVREPGRYCLVLRRGDGSEHRKTINLDVRTPRHQVLALP